jgi:hypothetical protein
VTGTSAVITQLRVVTRLLTAPLLTGWKVKTKELICKIPNPLKGNDIHGDDFFIAFFVRFSFWFYVYKNGDSNDYPFGFVLFIEKG